MSLSIIKTPITDEAQWHDLRAGKIGASECSALFDQNPFMSKYELFQKLKQGFKRPDSHFNNRVATGKLIESAILQMCEHFLEWTVEKCQDYYSLGPLGASIDAWRYDENGKQIVEIKNIQSEQYRDKWYNRETGLYEPPLHYLLQVQQQMLCSGITEGWIVAYVDTELKLFRVSYNATVCKAILNKAQAFMACVEQGEAPPPSMPSDWDVVRACRRPIREGLVTDLPELIAPVLAEYAEVAEQKPAIAKKYDVLKAQLLEVMGEANIGLCGSYRLRRKENKRGAITLEIEVMEMSDYVEAA